MTAIAYCPTHAVKLRVYKTRGCVRYLRCPVDECEHTKKMPVAPVQQSPTICHCGGACEVRTRVGVGLLMICPKCGENYRIPCPVGYEK